jgi:hypothetical protein
MRGRKSEAAAATGGVDHGPGPVTGLLGLEELGFGGVGRRGRGRVTEF